MEEYYGSEFGARGSILYPTRRAFQRQFDDPPTKLSRAAGPLHYAYAGAIHSKSAAEQIALLARTISPVGGNVFLYGGIDARAAVLLGLNLPNIILRGRVPKDELVEMLRQDADVLFISMSFSREERSNMEICFPSKLTDYTAIGLPLLISGPPYSSAIRWAKENPCVAELVEDSSASTLAAAVSTLATNPQRRITLAHRAIHVGNSMFAYPLVCKQFFDALRLVNMKV